MDAVECGDHFGSDNLHEQELFTDAEHLLPCVSQFHEPRLGKEEHDAVDSRLVPRSQPFKLGGMNDPVKVKIDELLSEVTRQVQDRCSVISFDLGTYSSADPMSEDPSRPHRPMSSFRFPGNSPEDSWRFSVALKLLGLIQDALSSGAVMSKRDIFYKEPALFGSQVTVDRYCDSIAAAFGATRGDLNIIAASKGLISSNITVHHLDGTKLDFDAGEQSVNCPVVNEMSLVDLHDHEFILVVEKEASFQSILMSDSWSKIRHKVIMMTGKGYPDLATRQLLHALAHPSSKNGFRELPVHILTDLDPDGLSIFNVYKFGSAALEHEGSATLCPRATRIGLNMDQMDGISRSEIQQEILPLTTRDRRKANLMLTLVKSRDAEQLQQLQVMLVLNVKAELQILDDFARSGMGLLETLCI